MGIGGNGTHLFSGAILKQHTSLMGDFNEHRDRTVRAFSKTVAETCGDSVDTSLGRPRGAVAHTVNEDMNVA